MRFRLPWARLTREQIPELVVVRRALDIGGGSVLQVGEKYPAARDGQELKRCRQYYEARRIGVKEPVSQKPVARSQEPVRKEKEKNGRSKK